MLKACVRVIVLVIIFFFFQAEDGIRDFHVTGVQTCAFRSRRVIGALGIGTSATHMEWFFGPKGLKFSEIGCRPPGVGAWDLYSAGNDMDVYRAWANAIVHGETGP